MYSLCMLSRFSSLQPAARRPLRRALPRRARRLDGRRRAPLHRRRPGTSRPPSCSGSCPATCSGTAACCCSAGAPPTCSAGAGCCSSRWASSPSRRPLGGLVDDGTLLIVTRFLKGAAAAFTAPAGLSIITTTFAEGPERNRALSIYTATGASGFSLGLVLGGLLTELGWRWTFLLPVPIALALLAVGRRVIPHDRGAGAVAPALRRPRRRDPHRRDAAARADDRGGARPGLGLAADDRALALARSCWRSSWPSSGARPPRSCGSGSCARARWCGRTSA